MPRYMLFVSIAYTHYCAPFVLFDKIQGMYIYFHSPHRDHPHGTAHVFFIQGVEKYPKRTDRLSMSLFFYFLNSSCLLPTLVTVLFTFPYQYLPKLNTAVEKEGVR